MNIKKPGNKLHHLITDINTEQDEQRNTANQI